MSQLILNSTQVPNYLIDEIMPLVSPVAFQIIIIIARQTYGWIEDPLTGRRKEKDWISYSQFTRRTGKETQAIAKALRELTSMDLIEVLDQDGVILKTREECIGKKLFYRIKTSLKIKDLNSNLFENQNLKIKDTKETNTKTLSKDKDSRPSGISCPLNVSPLKDKYPNGHTECVEYVTYFKFVNKGKQFRSLHQMLRAGLDFQDIDRLIGKIQKKQYYIENGYDMATVAAEADRRSNAQT